MIILSYFPSLKTLFYFWYGVFATIYFYMLFFSKKDNNSNSNSGNPLSSEKATTNPSSKSTVFYGPNKESYVSKIYLNMYFLDRRETIRNIVRSKVPKNRPVIRALAKRAAVRLLEKGFVEKVATNLCKAIPERLEAMGVTITASLGYTQGAYACMELTFSGLDIYKFLAFNIGSKEKARNIVDLLDKYSIPAVNNWIQRSILSFMASKMITSFPTTMKEKLYAKMNAEVEIVACSEEEQGPYLVQTIAQLNSDKEAPSAKEESEEAH